LFVGFCTVPMALMVVEPLRLAQGAVLQLGGRSEEAVVVDVQQTDTTMNAVPVWQTEVALVRDESIRQVGYTTGLVHSTGDPVQVQCALVTCSMFRIPQTRATKVGLGLNLGLGGFALFMVLLPIRSLWRRRWWVVALERGTCTRGWVEGGRRSSESVQRLPVHFDDAHDARWQHKYWLGYREHGFASDHLTVLYVEDDPRKAVVLEALQDWMGDRVPEAGGAWPHPDIAAWLRVSIGLAAFGASLFIVHHVVG
ncbi:MAG TPA: hypothetical protein DFR83_29445, partial [Deltaproteobacteria bacterium]|nr:hypothetical protein [Deltaproteobacteria bacterium]